MFDEIKPMQSNLDLRSLSSYLARSYLIAPVILENKVMKKLKIFFYLIDKKKKTKAIVHLGK